MMAALPPTIGDGLARSLVMALGSDCGVGAALARTMLAHPDGTIDLAAVDVASTGSLTRVLTDFAHRRWLQLSDDGWRAGPRAMPPGLPAFLAGAAAMRTILPDEGRATAVVTMPPLPSAIARALPLGGPAHAALRSTQETFERVARAAVARLTIMSPFLNREGLQLALDLFRDTPAPTKRLVIRRSGGARATVLASRENLIQESVEVFDYTLRAGDGIETFHAKVILADQDLAYVGSANMTVFSRHSMELGVLMDGRAARVISTIVRAVERIARPVEIFELLK